MIVAVKRGIAPAMQCNYLNAFWGQHIPEGVAVSTRKLLGCKQDEEVPSEVKKTLNQALRMALNARQCLATIKGPFGQGVDPVFPEAVLGNDTQQGLAYQGKHRGIGRAISLPYRALFNTFILILIHF